MQARNGDLWYSFPAPFYFESDWKKVLLLRLPGEDLLYEIPCCRRAIFVQSLCGFAREAENIDVINGKHLGSER